MKVYLAAQYARRDELRQYREQLNAQGIYVTSRWLNERESLTTNMGDHSVDFYIETANIDIEDIDAADALVFFAEDPLVGIKRGGRHVEFGYALAKGKPIYVINYKENVFHYLQGIQHFDTFEDFIAFITILRGK
jgi:nucleoside 2-deoxyribosyltransferase